MTPTETAAILRKFAQCLRADKYLWGASLPGVSAEVGAAIESAIEMIDRLEAAEKSDAESIAMYRKARDERDALRADKGTLQLMLYSIKNHLEAAEKSDAESIAMYRKARDERDALRAKIEQMEKQEPVAWQARCRPDWGDGTWSAWELCSENYAKDTIRVSVLHNWIYEARALYALPGVKGE